MNVVVVSLYLCLILGALPSEGLEPPRIMEPVHLSWATPAWIEFASWIVASEARGVPAADKVVACTLVRDVERGWNPWLLRNRWFGWGRPDAADRKAVLQAVSGGCGDVPDYLYVGNYRDAQHWRSVGMIGNAPVDLYLGAGGSAVVGVFWPVRRAVQNPWNAEVLREERLMAHIFGYDNKMEFETVRGEHIVVITDGDIEIHVDSPCVDCDEPMMLDEELVFEIEFPPTKENLIGFELMLERKGRWN